MSEDIVLDVNWLSLLDYLCTFGIKESQFLQMYKRHVSSLQNNVCSAQQTIDYLLSVGVKHRDIKRILLRQPQIMEYTVESNLKSLVGFFTGFLVYHVGEDIGKVCGMEEPLEIPILNDISMVLGYISQNDALICSPRDIEGVHQMSARRRSRVQVPEKGSSGEGAGAMHRGVPKEDFKLVFHEYRF